VLPTSSAREAVSFNAACAWVVTVKNWDHNIDSLILDEQMINIRVGCQIETVMIEPTVINRIKNILQHDCDLGRVWRGKFKHFCDRDNAVIQVKLAVL